MPRRFGHPYKFIEKYIDDRLTVRTITADDVPGFLGGLGLVDHATNYRIVVTAGAAADSTGTEFLRLAAALSKDISIAWAVGDVQGGLDAGSVANSTWYHVWLIKRSSTGVVDFLFSLSATAPTMPAGYDLKRRLGSVFTDSGGTTNMAFTQDGDRFKWKVRVQETQTSSPGTSAVTVTLASVPLGVVVFADLQYLYGGGTNASAIYTALDETDTTPSISANDIFCVNNITHSIPVTVKTNTSAQYRSRVTNGIGVVNRVQVKGWIDRRGRG